MTTHTERMIATERARQRAEWERELAAFRSFTSLTAALGGSVADAQRVALMLKDMGTDAALVQRALVYTLEQMCGRLYDRTRSTGDAPAAVAEYMSALAVLEDARLYL